MSQNGSGPEPSFYSAKFTKCAGFLQTACEEASTTADLGGGRNEDVVNQAMPPPPPPRHQSVTSIRCSKGASGSNSSPPPAQLVPQTGDGAHVPGASALPGSNPVPGSAQGGSAARLLQQQQHSTTQAQPPNPSQKRKASADASEAGGSSPKRHSHARDSMEVDPPAQQDDRCAQPPSPQPSGEGRRSQGRAPNQADKVGQCEEVQELHRQLKEFKAAFAAKRAELDEKEAADEGSVKTMVQQLEQVQAALKAAQHEKDEAQGQLSNKQLSEAVFREELQVVRRSISAWQEKCGTDNNKALAQEMLHRNQGRGVTYACKLASATNGVQQAEKRLCKAEQLLQKQEAAEKAQRIAIKELGKVLASSRSAVTNFKV
ncbi:hypothetical protein DUNSADRAFT_15885 [Dunaliella salina]|uniref:Uncharacterized protein n=1 Tax=Dunaliella salina TaxID=3046 RepID=A0ABQ7G4N6_DUNSA|nr:hypothetical protein DUNSADRAFT_15885 [Dunaliella salina]|eukprot:KAF5829570.1 hypothetical protein DUNSADRAFT_15885 [Dunaliella salina]